MTLEEKQEQMIQEINSLGDCFDQYSYLIVKGQQLTHMPESQKTSEALVKGCQSQVWLYVWAEQQCLRFDADSDTLILRGVLQLLKELLEFAPLDEVAHLSVRLFTETELSATFTSNRSTGVKTILETIQKYGQF